ncbi:MAG: helix-turn-helix transcriptional regulator [Trueperaceae bacterium]
MRDEALFGLWLRRRRKSLGLTRSDLADRAGCSTATVRKIEAEERRPSLELGAKFAEILDIPSDERRAVARTRRGGRLTQKVWR